MNLPPLPIVPEPLRGQSWLMIRGCYCGSLSAATATDRAMAQVAYTPAFDQFQEMPFSQVAEDQQRPRGPTSRFEQRRLDAPTQ